MGDKLIYPTLSEKYKEIIDTEVANLIQDAYKYGEYIIRNSKDLIMDGVEILLRDKVLKEETLSDLIESKYNNSLNTYHLTISSKKGVYKKI
jgi:ATP-dependent Zn protease